MPLRQRKTGAQGQHSGTEARTKAQPHPVSISAHRALIAAPWVLVASLWLLLIPTILPLQDESGLTFDVGLANFESGGFRMGPRGNYPAGCIWRELHHTSESTCDEFKEGRSESVAGKAGRMNSMLRHPVELEYRTANGTWGLDIPDSCSMAGLTKDPSTWRWPTAAGPRSDVDCQTSHCTYKNLWYNGGRWYAVVDGPVPGGTFPITKRTKVNSLHVLSPSSWLKTVKWRVVPGDTVVLDFIHLSHPTAIGHWPEMLNPLYSTLRSPTAFFGKPFRLPPDQFVLLHLQRKYLMEWVRGVLAASLGTRNGAQMPPILLQGEGGDELSPRGGEALLEGLSTDTWICFPRALVVKDHYRAGGTRTFASSKHAQAFRTSIFRLHGLTPPVLNAVPRQITFLRKATNRRILNEADLLQTLKEFGHVQVAEFNSTTSLKNQLQGIAGDGQHRTVGVRPHLAAGQRSVSAARRCCTGAHPAQLVQPSG